MRRRQPPRSPPGGWGRRAGRQKKCVKYLISITFLLRCGSNFCEVVVSPGDSRTQVNHYLTVMAANSAARDERRAAIATVFRKERTFMPFRPPVRASISRHGEKEQRLRQFVLQHIGTGPERSHKLMVVARSLDSPVVKAIAGLDQMIAAAGGSVRLILAQIDDEAQCQAGALRCRHEIRWARHPRLIEAHEQLVLSPQTCWIGDCMRRDPSKCDAFENYVEDCGEAAGCAAVSFERLWFASTPLAGAQAAAAGAPLPPNCPVAAPSLSRQ